MSKITEQVEVIVKPIMEDLNFELVDVEYVKEGRDHFLRISIDKEGGVDLNDCTLASEKISEAMDANEIKWHRLKRFQQQANQQLANGLLNMKC